MNATMNPSKEIYTIKTPPQSKIVRIGYQYPQCPKTLIPVDNKNSRDETTNTNIHKIYRDHQKQLFLR